MDVRIPKRESSQMYSTWPVSQPGHCPQASIWTSTLGLDLLGGYGTVCTLEDRPADGIGRYNITYTRAFMDDECLPFMTCLGSPYDE